MSVEGVFVVVGCVCVGRHVGDVVWWHGVSWGREGGDGGGEWRGGEGSRG